MYSWNEDTSSWYGSKTYKYGARGSSRRKSAAIRADAHGPRTYDKKNSPNLKIIDPSKNKFKRNPKIQLSLPLM